MSTYEEKRDVAQELEVYTALMYNEMGEAGNLLIQLAGYHDYVSEKFNKELLKELKRQLKNYQDHCRIVEYEETHVHKHEELEWTI
jgi:hypothetical protein